MPQPRQIRPPNTGQPRRWTWKPIYNATGTRSAGQRRGVARRAGPRVGRLRHWLDGQGEMVQQHDLRVKLAGVS
jgi:hypothetical protein